MWLLEADSNAFGGRRLWLRPGKLYLFGRTASEPGQLAISHQTISRRHMTIQVNVSNGDSQRLSTRSTLTIEDLKTKSGTTVDGHKFKGEKFVVSEAAVHIKMGNCPDSFRLSWNPVVLTFSFSNRTLKPDTIDRLRDRLEQLDVKFCLDYQIGHTTHVVSKKRNTSKGLQALINGKYIVTDAFVDALEVAATVPEGEIDDPSGGSALEKDFDESWPNPLQYLPPRGGEPVERPNSAYAPDDSRQEVFDGYTFIFYDSGQYETLLAPITNGKGKALYTEVKPGETSVDDFILFVKTEAGEKGLGSFEDGSDGRGVVVVRYVPAKGPHIDWFARFFTDVSQRLDHRPIEQNEFLEAILQRNAAILRRALEAEPSQPAPIEASQMPSVEAAPRRATRSSQRQPAPEPEPAVSPPPRRRSRKEPTKRFKGFDDSSDDETKLPTIPDISQPPLPADSQEGLFVSQEVEPMIIDESVPTSSAPSRKRQAQELDAELLDDIAPGAAAAKRRRIEAGEDPTPWRSAAEAAAAEAAEAEATKKAALVKKDSKAPKKIKVEIDVLEEARKQREKLDAQAKAEEEDLARLPADLDFAAIRRNHIIEPMKVRTSRREPTTREEDIASGRWDPKWNGLKNFKKFRQQGAPTGRPPVKVIVPLKEVKAKAYGIGDDYWLEDEGSRKKSKDTQRSTQSSALPDSPVRSLARKAERVVLTDDSDMDDFVEETPQPAAPARGARSMRSAATQSQGTGAASTASQSTRQSKRSAEVSAAGEPPAKKAKPARRAFEIKDSDDEEDSDDGLQFKFGRRKKK